MAFSFLNCINLNEIVYRNAYHGLVLDYGALQNTGFETFNYDFVLFVVKLTPGTSNSFPQSHTQ